jgi:hypothetical protein
MMKKRLTRNEHGDPVLTITVTGTSDVYRIGWYLQRAAVDHASLGRRIHRSMKRLIGAANFRFIERQMHGTGNWR